MLCLNNFYLRKVIDLHWLLFYVLDIIYLISISVIYVIIKQWYFLLYLSRIPLYLVYICYIVAEQSYWEKKSCWTQEKFLYLSTLHWNVTSVWLCDMYILLLRVIIMEPPSEKYMFSNIFYMSKTNIYFYQSFTGAGK